MQYFCKQGLIKETDFLMFTFKIQSSAKEEELAAGRPGLSCAQWPCCCLTGLAGVPEGMFGLVDRPTFPLIAH